MTIFCRIGLHRWAFSSELREDPRHLGQTEFVRARCTRQGCAHYGAWSLVHKESRVVGRATLDSPATIA